MSSSEAVSPIMIRTGSPVSCSTKKTTVTTPKTTMTDCHNRRMMYCVMPCSQESGVSIQETVIPSVAKDLTDPPRCGCEMFRCAQHDMLVPVCCLLIPDSSVQPFQSISWAQTISSLRGSHFTQLSTP